jgi:2-polyprenyl-6-methoxyphenol hydroxylase-like FAD-dependent oxidoreductase
MSPTHTDLLIIGAGPTGLTAAAQALQAGLRVRLVERRAERARRSKALVLHARTMEALELLGCAAPLVARGARFRALHIHTHPGRHRSTVDLLDRAWGDTEYPYWLSVPQYETEQVLEARVGALGGTLEWSTALTGLVQHDDHVEATLEGPDGTERHRARWVLGCDGGRSTTRELAGLRMERTELGVTFALADVHTTTDLPGDEGHMVFADAGVLLIVPMPEAGVWRLIAHVDPDAPALDAAGWQALVRARSGFDLGITGAGWRSRFALSSGVAPRLREGRVFLLGDAAHVHSPVGGQGLNTGIQDAQNLVWKLALAAEGALAPAQSAALIDSYAEERHPIATAMVRATERATRLLTLRSPLLRAVRRNAARLLLRSARLKNLLGRGVGMLDLRTAGHARLPNPTLGSGRRLYGAVRPSRPVRLQLEDRALVVRPDRVAAPPGTWPVLDTLDLDTLDLDTLDLDTLDLDTPETRP